jgi:hypothetical protein
MSRALQHCHISGNQSIMGGRTGTVAADESELVARFGNPLPVDSADGKVTKRWVIATPRGPVEVRDYWWNGPSEWSIASANHKATKWAVRFLKAHDIKAHRGIGA